MFASVSLVANLKTVIAEQRNDVSIGYSICMVGSFR